MLRRDSRCDSACGWLRMARPSRSRSGSSDSGAKCSSGVAFAKATILTRIALDARFPNKSESAFGVEAGFESSSESPRIAYCDRPYCCLHWGLGMTQVWCANPRRIGANHPSGNAARARIAVAGRRSLLSSTSSVQRVSCSPYRLTACSL